MLEKDGEDVREVPTEGFARCGGEQNGQRGGKEAEDPTGGKGRSSLGTCLVWRCSAHAAVEKIDRPMADPGRQGASGEAQLHADSRREEPVPSVAFRRHPATRPPSLFSSSTPQFSPLGWPWSTGEGALSSKPAVFERFSQGRLVCLA